MDPVRLDIGCGSAKEAGCIGLDKEAGHGVDCIVDVERQPLPFADRTVDEIFSAHCLEHLGEHAMVFHEMSRVAKNGARLEIWTPYAWTNEAFIYTHRTFFNEAHYLHPCYLYPDQWDKILGARWQLTTFQFLLSREVLADLARNTVSLDFALKYLKGVAIEFGVHIRIWHENAPQPVPPERTYSFERAGERFPVEPDAATPRGTLGARLRRILAR